MTDKGSVKIGWVSQLRAGLAKTAGKVGATVGSVFSEGIIDNARLKDLEEVLIGADFGVSTSQAFIKKIADMRHSRVKELDVRERLASEIADVLEPVAKPLDVDPERKPYVILVAGVNGTGKTTTIGKFAAKFVNDGKTVMLVAGDTFRAAAIQQLQVWGDRTGSVVLSGAVGSDAAALAFDGLTQARSKKVDVLIIDTAGRLHNKADLMAELQKIPRVLAKIDDSAPHCVALVLDATTGQNAHNQVELFREHCGVTGLVMTKLDGTASGGMLVALASKFALPVYAIGVGEGVEDLQALEPRAFARAIMGLEP